MGDPLSGITPFPCLDRCHTSCVGGELERKGKKPSSCPEARCGKFQSAVTLLNPFTIVGPGIFPKVNPFGGASHPVLRGIGGVATVGLLALPILTSIARHMKAREYCLEDTGEMVVGIVRDTGTLFLSHLAGAGAGFLAARGLGLLGLQGGAVVFCVAAAARIATTYGLSRGLYQTLNA